MSTTLIIALVLLCTALLHAQWIWRWTILFKRLRAGPDVRDRTEAPPFISVIVPVRNGQDTLPALLQDLHAQDHPTDRMEVLVVDDNSADATGGLVEGMKDLWPGNGLSLHRLVGAQGKKAAIAMGLEHAQGDLVLLTDADVRCGPQRLSCLATHWRHTGQDLVLMPVRTEGAGWTGAVQEEEQAALLAAAAASAADGRPLLAFGANMAFTPEAFRRVGGHAGELWASGDDMFLLRRMRRARARIGFLLHPAVLVSTTAEENWHGLLAQRLRWAGKMRAVGGTLPAMFALMLPLVLLAGTLYVAVHGTLGQGLLRSWGLLCVAWALWAGSLLGLVRASWKFLEDDRGLARQLPATSHGAGRTFVALLLFSGYAPLIALLSLVLRPRWKGRRV